MIVPRDVKKGISPLLILGVILFFVVMGYFALTFSGILHYNTSQLIYNSNNTEKIISLKDALNDLTKNGCLIIETTTIPENIYNKEYLQNFTDFVKIAESSNQVQYSVTTEKCTLATIKDDTLFLWIPVEWTRIKILDYSCQPEPPGWEITIKIQNAGNTPTQIQRIYVDGGELSYQNWGTSDYVPLSISTDLKTEQLIGPAQILSFQVRVSRLSQFVKAGITQFELVDVNGLNTKMMVNLE
jgi:hypothetical protein